MQSFAFKKHIDQNVSLSYRIRIYRPKKHEGLMVIVDMLDKVHTGGKNEIGQRALDFTGIWA